MAPARSAQGITSPGSSAPALLRASRSTGPCYLRRVDLQLGSAQELREVDHAVGQAEDLAVHAYAPPVGDGGCTITRIGPDMPSGSSGACGPAFQRVIDEAAHSRPRPGVPDHAVPATPQGPGAAAASRDERAAEPTAGTDAGATRYGRAIRQAAGRLHSTPAAPGQGRRETVELVVSASGRRCCCRRADPPVSGRVPWAAPRSGQLTRPGHPADNRSLGLARKLPQITQRGDMPREAGGQPST